MMYAIIENYDDYEDSFEKIVCITPSKERAEQIKKECSVKMDLIMGLKSEMIKINNDWMDENPYPKMLSLAKFHTPEYLAFNKSSLAHSVVHKKYLNDKVSELAPGLVLKEDIIDHRYYEYSVEEVEFVE